MRELVSETLGLVLNIVTIGIILGGFLLGGFAGRLAGPAIVATIWDLNVLGVAANVPLRALLTLAGVFLGGLVGLAMCAVFLGPAYVLLDIRGQLTLTDRAPSGGPRPESPSLGE